MLYLIFRNSQKKSPEGGGGGARAILGGGGCLPRSLLNAAMMFTLTFAMFCTHSIRVYYTQYTCLLYHLLCSVHTVYMFTLTFAMFYTHSIYVYFNICYVLYTQYTCLL